ncbi:MAG: class II aldolase/adducin family protein, partial [Dehalococcoidia bacterium]|nr:class II aldolase/adducin family protein [Dehalococcoidia bacterium]
LVDGFGHISVRVPGTDTYLIPPRMSPALVKPADIVTINLEGCKVAGEKLPTNEIALHTRIYCARPDVNSVAHTHSPMVITLGVTGQTVRPMHNQGVAFHAGVSMFNRPGLINTNEIADEMVAALGQRQAVMLRGHGANIVSSRLKLATLWAVTLEEAARFQIVASSIGKPVFFSEADFDMVGRDLFEAAGGETQITRAWDYYVSRIQPF